VRPSIKSIPYSGNIRPPIEEADDVRLLVVDWVVFSEGGCCCCCCAAGGSVLDDEAGLEMVFIEGDI